MWNCAKECGYWNDGCIINYTPESFLLLCPCYEMAITHARDPTPRQTSSRSKVNDRSQRAAQPSAVKARSQIPINRDHTARIGALQLGTNPYFSGKEKIP